MANTLDALIGQIAEPALRAELAREVGKLKAQKKFGLVFEEHQPELVQLPSLPVRPGGRVMKRGGSPKEFFTVRAAVNGSKVRIVRELDGQEEVAAVAELVTVKKFGEPVFPALVPVASVMRDPARPHHALINADNFHALQLLLYTHEGQVDVIYIDPPYNTGARDWKYNNDYVDANDQWRHSKWLSMMNRRLLLAKRLLKPTGVLVVAIDDNEMHHLRCLLGSIFTPDLHMGTVCVRHKPGGTTTARKIARSHEYAFIWGASDLAVPQMLPRTDEQLSRFKHTDAEGLFEWENFRKHGQGCRRTDRPHQFYPIWLTPKGKLKLPKMEYDKKGKQWNILELLPSGWVEIWPMRGREQRVWLWSHDNFEKTPELFKHEVVRGEHTIYKKRRPNRVGVVPNTMWTDTKYSANEHGSGMIVKIFGSTEPFDFAKSLYTVADCISLACDKKDALILDFFAGSGTTFHATALLNSEDGGQRQCIMVTNNEVRESLAKQLNSEGHFAGSDSFEKHGICESVTWPRSVAVIDGKRGDGSDLPGTYLSGKPLKEGFTENIDYFRLTFLDRDAVAYGEEFEAIAPMLWLMAGARGELETARGYGKWFMPKQSPFGVLIQETAFTPFLRELESRPDVTHVFLVTDSEQSYREMLAKLPRKFTTRMLYKSYLENFRINTEGNL
jgi:adenine-specific DNA-methyltransferase